MPNRTFSVGGAIDAPELHQVVLDQLIKELVGGGMPAEIAVDIINNSAVGEIRIPLIAQNCLNNLLNTMPLPLTVYVNDTVERELQKTLPMYNTKAPEVKAEERDKYIAAHQRKIVAHEIEVKRAENDIKRWDKIVFDIKGKQSTFCSAIMKLCDPAMSSYIKNHPDYNHPVMEKSLQHNIVLLITEIIRLAELSTTVEPPVGKLWSLFFQPYGVDENIDDVVTHAHIRFKAYVKAATAVGERIDGKEKIIVNQIIFHNIVNTDEPIYIVLKEKLLTIKVPDTFEDLIAIITNCKDDIAANKSIALNSLAVVTKKLAAVQATFATMNTDLKMDNVKPSDKDKPDKPDKSDKPTKPDKPGKKRDKDKDKGKDKSQMVCIAAALNCLDDPAYKTAASGNTTKCCPRLSNGAECPFNHDLNKAKLMLTEKLNGVTTNEIVPYPTPFSHLTLPYNGRVTLIGGTPASDSISPWYPPHTILLDEGSNVHCANNALMDTTSLYQIDPKYNGTIGGWVRTDHSGVMLHTGLQCDYTPHSPFNIISKTIIEQDPNWKLTEVSNHQGKSYILFYE